MKRLERSRTDRVIQGVCGGLGEYLGVDTNLVRVLWILAVLCGGAGIIPYLVAIFLLPEGEAPAEPRADNGTRILGLVLLALAGFFFLRAFHVDWFGARVFAFWTLGILLPLALLVAGIFLVWPRTRDAVGFARHRKPHRSVSDRVIAGVAGGIAGELGTDANLVRLAFVLAGVLTSGFAALIYLLLVVILPEEELEAPPVVMMPPPGPPPSSPPPPAPVPEAPAGETPAEPPAPSDGPATPPEPESDSGTADQEPGEDRR